MCTLSLVSIYDQIAQFFVISFWKTILNCIFCLSDYAFPYIILVMSLVTLAVYMSASEIQVIVVTVLWVFVIHSRKVTVKDCTKYTPNTVHMVVVWYLNLKAFPKLKAS